MPSATDNGVEFNNVSLVNINGLSIPASGGHGYVINGARLISIFASSSSGNTKDGMNITDADNVNIQANLSANGESGAELVSGNRHVNFNNCAFNGNTGDGLKLTATSDECKLSNSDIDDNGALGVNIANSNCDNNQISDNFFDNNTSGDITDLGTGTLIRDNIPDSLNDSTSAVKSFHVTPIRIQNVLTQGLWVGQQIESDLSAAEFMFKIPDNFSSISQVHVFGWAEFGRTAEDHTVKSSYGLVGEAFNNTTETATVSVTHTTDRIIEIDVSGVLASITAQDYVALTVISTGSGNTSVISGLYFEYNTT